jgi:hypothetical protein
MRTDSGFRAFPRKKCLAACLGALFFPLLATASPVEAPSAVLSGLAPALPIGTRFRHAPKVPSAMHSVTTCADDGSPGSLRSIVGDMNTHSTDTIDLSMLVCSKITLDPNKGAIQVPQDSLYFHGPAAPQTPLTIDAASQSRVLYHTGVGTLYLANLTIANGFYNSSVAPFGGCIFSLGSVALVDSVVSHCWANSAANHTPSARGGGIYSVHDLYLYRSTIIDGKATSTVGAYAVGGAAYVAGNLYSYQSTIAYNNAFPIGTGKGYAGGLAALGNASVALSTISGNSASGAGAMAFNGPFPHTVAIIESTVSGNAASQSLGGIESTVPLALKNSTIAFNHSNATIGNSGDGVFAIGQATLESSIIADNFNLGGQSDLFFASTLSGANNLATSLSAPPPPGVFVSTACPKLEALGDNGGPTLTHRIASASPAIDLGDNNLSFNTDQRLAPRVFPTGGSADIGAVEWRPSDSDDRITIDGFDNLCDR